MTDNARIIRLTAQDFKILKAVEITPDGNLVVIGGRNGQGKTSVLDAITAALGGVNNKALPKPIREGADSAQIVLELDDLIVTRKFTGSGSSVTVTSKDGAKYPKGQAKLDSLLGKLSLDPLAFTQMDPKVQRETLIKLVELPFDPAVLDARRKAGFDARTEVNREVDRLDAQIKAAPPVPDEPLKPLSVTDLLNEVTHAEAAARRERRAQQAIETTQLRIRQAQEQIEEAAKDLAEEMAELKAAAAEAVATRSPQVIRAELEGAEEHNHNVHQQQNTLDLIEQHKQQAAKSASFTAALKAIEDEKAAGLAAATFPVEGLGFDADGVTYNKIPFKQASGAEQLRVSLAMAMALNPELRVIRIADGSLLDSDNLKLVADMAAEHDYQVWLEYVGEGAGGIIIEDGAIAE